MTPAEFWLGVAGIILIPLIGQAVSYGMMRQEVKSLRETVMREGEEGFVRRRELDTMRHERERLLDENDKKHARHAERLDEQQVTLGAHGERIGALEVIIRNK